MLQTRLAASYKVVLKQSALIHLQPACSHIIKRFDTGAVSASSLFRAAFPTATEEEEAAEMVWISKGSRNRYGDTRAAGLEHDETKKLSGTWCGVFSLAFAFATRQYVVSANQC